MSRRLAAIVYEEPGNNRLSSIRYNRLPTVCTTIDSRPPRTTATTPTARSPRRADTRPTRHRRVPELALRPIPPSVSWRSVRTTIDFPTISDHRPYGPSVDQLSTTETTNHARPEPRHTLDHPEPRPSHGPSYHELSTTENTPKPTTCTTINSRRPGGTTANHGLRDYWPDGVDESLGSPKSWLDWDATCHHSDSARIWRDAHD